MNSVGHTKWDVWCSPFSNLVDQIVNTHYANHIILIISQVSIHNLS